MSRRLPGHIRLIEMLEDGAAELDRKVEGLASDEVLTQRGRSGQGLERPELAVVLAYAKMAVYDALVISPLVTDRAARPRPPRRVPAGDAGALSLPRSTTTGCGAS